MKKLSFVLVILVVLQLSPVLAQPTLKFDMQAAPAKLRFDGEYNLISVGTIFGGVLEFKLANVPLKLGIHLAPQINSLAADEVVLGEVVSLEIFNKFGVGLFWDNWKSGAGNGFQGFRIDNTGFTLTYNFTIKQ